MTDEKHNKRNICYCGHDCSRRVTYVATKNNKHTLREESQKFYKEVFGLDIPLEEFNCSGGRSDNVFELCEELSDYQGKYVNKCNQI